MQTGITLFLKDNIIMKTKVLFLLVWGIASSVFAQEFMPIWKGVKMPNSKGIEVKDSYNYT
jgi:hypothetical protein